MIHAYIYMYINEREWSNTKWMIHFCTRGDPPPFLSIFAKVVLDQNPSDKQTGRQTGKAKTVINSRAGFRMLICFFYCTYLFALVLDAGIYLSLLECKVSPRFAETKKKPLKYLTSDGH